MTVDDVVGTIYNSFLREALTYLLQNSHVSIDRSALRETSQRCIPVSETDSLYFPIAEGPPPIPPGFEEIQETVEVPEMFVCDVSQTQLIGPELVAITPGNRYIREETVAKPQMVTDALVRTLYKGTLPVRLRGAREFDRPVASLAGIQSRTYFHWFADYLPRVRGLEKYAEVTGTYPNVLVPQDQPAWMRASIDYVGIPEERLIEWNGGRAVANTLVIPSVPRRVDSHQVVYAPRELRWLGECIKSNVDPDTTDDERLLVTRRGASTRRIANENELIDALRPLGFDPVNLTELSFEKQVELFAGTSAVIAPHGAGLINMIYSEDIQILEIFGDFVTPLYYCIAAGLGFPYRYERSKTTQPTVASPGVSAPGDDLVVDVERLETIVREWIIE